MRPFRYHAGQRAVQMEANSRACADKLALWVGPAAEFSRMADLIVMASTVGLRYRIGAISGPPPLVEASESAGVIVVQMPAQMAVQCGVDQPWGGIALNPSLARRSRIAGMPMPRR